jgi:hypothetical protein
MREGRRDSVLKHRHEEMKRRRSDTKGVSGAVAADKTMASAKRPPFFAAAYATALGKRR